DSEACLLVQYALQPFIGKTAGLFRLLSRHNAPASPDLLVSARDSNRAPVPPSTGRYRTFHQPTMPAAVPARAPPRGARHQPRNRTTRPSRSLAAGMGAM